MTTHADETTELDTVFQNLTLDALEFGLPCDGVPTIKPDCEQPAQWQALFDCGCTRLWCDFHKERAEGIVAKAGGTWCNTCFARTGEWHHATITYIDSLKSS